MAAQETQGFPRADTMEGIVSGWEKLMQDLPMILSRMALAGILVVIGIAVLKFGRFLIKRAQKRSQRANDDASASRWEDIQTMAERTIVSFEEMTEQI